VLSLLCSTVCCLEVCQKSRTTTKQAIARIGFIYETEHLGLNFSNRRSSNALYAIKHKQLGLSILHTHTRIYNAQCNFVNKKKLHNIHTLLILKCALKWHPSSLLTGKRVTFSTVPTSCRPMLSCTSKLKSDEYRTTCTEHCTHCEGPAQHFK